MQSFIIFTASPSLFKSIGVVYNLSLSNLSILDFKLAKSNFLANFDVSTLVTFFKSTFVAQLEQSNSTLIFHIKGLGLGNYLQYLLIYNIYFVPIQLLKESL